MACVTQPSLNKPLAFELVRREWIERRRNRIAWALGQSVTPATASHLGPAVGLVASLLHSLIGCILSEPV
jgi:hypothetical protein